MAAVEEEAVTGGVEKSLVVVLTVVVLVTGILWAVGEAGGVVWVALVALALVLVLMTIFGTSGREGNVDTRCM